MQYRVRLPSMLPFRPSPFPSTSRQSRSTPFGTCERYVTREKRNSAECLAVLNQAFKKGPDASSVAERRAVRLAPARPQVRHPIFPILDCLLFGMWVKITHTNCFNLCLRAGTAVTLARPQSGNACISCIAGTKCLFDYVSCKILASTETLSLNYRVTSNSEKDVNDMPVKGKRSQTIQIFKTR
jgi:hypothetical protein